MGRYALELDADRLINAAQYDDQKKEDFHENTCSVILSVLNEPSAHFLWIPQYKTKGTSHDQPDQDPLSFDIRVPRSKYYCCSRTVSYTHLTLPTKA